MTNLDSILKSRDITLPTKVLLVKAMVFPVVMYGCESWTIKKAELLPNAIYRFNEIPIKSPMAFFTELEQNISQVIWNYERP